MLNQSDLAGRRFPLFVDLTNRKCLVVGGGTMAVEKARLLLDFGAFVTILSHEGEREVGALEKNYASCSIENRKFNAGDLNGVTLVISATGDIEVDSIIANAATTLSIPVNVVDNKTLSTFFVPAIVDRGSIQLGISSGGKSPSLVARLKDQME